MPFRKSTKRIQFDSKSYKKCQKNKDFVHDEYGTCILQLNICNIPLSESEEYDI